MCLCEGAESPGAGVTDCWELLHGCWKLNPGPVEEWPVLLTAKPSVQSYKFLLYLGEN